MKNITWKEFLIGLAIVLVVVVGGILYIKYTSMWNILFTFSYGSVLFYAGWFGGRMFGKHWKK